MTPIRKESFLSSLRSSVLWKAVGRITGLIKHVIVAAAIGLSVQLDNFYMAMALVGVFVFTWARILEVLAVPALVQHRKADNQKAFEELAGSLFILALLFAALLSGLLYLARDLIVQIAFGFDTVRKANLADAMLWFLPVYFLYIPFHFIGSVFRATRRFSIFYQAELIIGVVTLLFIVLYKDHPDVLMWSFSAGMTVAFAFLCVHFCLAFKPWGNPFSNAVFAVLKVAPGLLMLQGAHYLYILTDRIFITFLAKGSIGALAYGRTLAFIWEDLVGIKNSFITVFSESGDADRTNQLYNRLFSLVIYIAIPMTAFLQAYGDAVITLFLERGVFSRSDTHLVDLALSGFAWALLPMLMQMPLEQIFQIFNRVDLMVKRKLCGLLVNVTLNSLFIFVFKWGIWGIAIATALSFWVVMLYSIMAASRLKLHFLYKRHLSWALWVALTTITGISAINAVMGDDAGLIIIGIKFILLAAIVLIAGLLYPGVEKGLVRDAVRHIGLRKAV